MALLEEDLKRIVCLHPELVEEGLTIVQEEFPIKGSKTYRCDLKGHDKNGTPVYVELKLTATLRVIGQISTYKSFAPEPGRFIVAALNFEPDVKTVIQTLDLEAVSINKETVLNLLASEQNNPLLYERKNATFSRIRKEVTCSQFPSYSEKETAIVECVMNQLVSLLENPLAEQGLILLQPAPHMRRTNKRDEFRLRFRSPINSKDEFVIYTRARIGDTILFCYVPDFSLNTGKTERKERFRDYILNNKEEIESIFGCDLYDQDYKRKMNSYDLRISTQAWKGLHQTINWPVNQWEKPDFVEMLGSKFIRFVENLLPLVRNFDVWQRNDAGYEY